MSHLEKNVVTLLPEMHCFLELVSLQTFHLQFPLIICLILVTSFLILCTINHDICEYRLPFPLSKVVIVLPWWWPPMQVLLRIFRKMWSDDLSFASYAKFTIQKFVAEMENNVSSKQVFCLTSQKAVCEDFHLVITPISTKHQWKLGKGPVNRAGRVASTSLRSVHPSSDTIWDQPRRIKYYHIN